jgi:hypothetical protein
MPSELSDQRVLSAGRSVAVEVPALGSRSTGESGSTWR